MFLSHLKICETINLQKNILEKKNTCEKIYLRNILVEKYTCGEKQRSEIVLCTVLFFFQKTTSNINYNTELKNNYISDKYNNDIYKVDNIFIIRYVVNNFFHRKATTFCISIIQTILST